MDSGGRDRKNDQEEKERKGRRARRVTEKLGKERRFKIIKQVSIRPDMSFLVPNNKEGKNYSDLDITQSQGLSFT